MKSLNQYITEFVVNKHITSTQEVMDLDLPSGLKWSTCNIGAEKPEDFGLLFQWGRVDGYKYGDRNHNFLSKDDYVTTSGTEYEKSDILDKKDDAAYQATNGELRMPTAEEIEELIKHTNNEWTELNGVKGMKFISKKDDSKWIFIPAGGGFSAWSRSFYGGGSDGYMWSSSVSSEYTDSAYYLYLGSSGCNCDYDRRHIGNLVRGVLNK